MKKYVVMFLLVFICSLSAQAELPGFDFSDYTAPDYTLKSLTVEFQPLVSYNSRKISNNSSDHSEKFWTSMVSASYSIEINRDKWNADLIIIDSVDYTKTVIDGITDSSKSHIPTLEGRLDYYFSGKFFTSVSAMAGYFHQDVKSFTDYHSHMFVSTGTGGFGYGKMEYVSYMRRALYIIDELYENRIIETYPEKRILVKLGQLLAEQNKTRVYDLRLSRIENIKMIDGFLKENGLLNDDSIEYFTILNDMLLYASVPYRENGWETGFDYIVSYRHNYVSTDTSSESINLKGMHVYLNYAKAINRYWQLDMSASCNFLDDTTKEIEETEDNNTVYELQ